MRVGITRHLLPLMLLLWISDSNGETVDFSVGIAKGFSTISADFKVKFVSGLAAFDADQKWIVVGACSNAPSITIEIVEGISAFNADFTVEIIARSTSISILVDKKVKKVCISNAGDLDEQTRSKLKLIL